MKSLVQLARKNRKHQTDAEQIIWVHIKDKQIAEVYFRRQMPIGKYIVDFVARKEKLIIELDGGQHNEETTKKYDAERTECFKRLGFTVIRFWNNEVLQNLDGVIQSLHLTLALSLQEREKK